ncbi:MAG: helix-turn-helix transcriptional regulator [Mycobacterium sp.]
MVTIEEYSRMVSAIHSAAITPEHWVVAMATVRRSLDGIACGLIIADGTSRLIKSASLDENAMAEYRDYYHDYDYVLEAVEHSPVGLVSDGRELVDRNLRSEFNTDWLRPHEMQDGIFVRLTGNTDPTCFLAAAPRRDDGFATSDRVTVVNALIPHFQQAMRTESHLAGLRLEVDDLAAAIDGMRRAVLVVGPNSIVLHCNTRAEALLSRNDGLSLRTGRLVADANDPALQRAVAAATGPMPRSGTSVACQRLSTRPYIAHVTPFLSEIENGCGRALVVIVDPDDIPTISADLLRRLYGLTAAESEVAVRVGYGQGLAPISEELSLSMATVKTHLHHVFTKTATSRQAELVRLLVSLAP